MPMTKQLMIENLKNDILNIVEKSVVRLGHNQKKSVNTVIENLDKGTLSVVSKDENDCWKVNEWIKQAILLYFKTQSSTQISNGFDKIPLKTMLWKETDFKESGFRLVPHSTVRFGAYIAPDVIVMPSFINIGARIEKGTMVDSGTTVGSCAYIGKNVHLSSNVMIGGVLEPLQALPVIIEDHCFIGAGSTIAEGIIVEKGSVIASGVHLTGSTKIIDRATGLVMFGKIPAYSVVVPGSYPTKNGLFLSCAVIVKKVDEQTREKTKINDLLRD
jgi:2,3,4,5-tetrahydropyridine-2-carboxylate N-succinyltransferase